jgi:long-chain acyl-CoA synthetase
VNDNPLSLRVPEDGLAGRADLDVITTAEAPTLDALFRVRLRRSANTIAYSEHDATTHLWRDYTWREIAQESARWRAAFAAEGLRAGERVALSLRNRVLWVIVDQAALSAGLVVVPLYCIDRPDNVHYVLGHSDARVLVLDTASRLRELASALQDLPALARIVVADAAEREEDPRVQGAESWLSRAGAAVEPAGNTPETLATLVYTSGTTGRPKGVMLTHRNIVANVHAGLQSVPVTPRDLFLSFLPLSHMLERTAGYYLPMAAGARVAFARSIAELAQDFMHVRPTIVIAVPRVFERVYARLREQVQASPLKRALFEWAVRLGWARFLHAQGRGPRPAGAAWWPLLDRLVAKRVRERLGGRLRIAIVGGAAMPPAISRVFLALGVEVDQGYGLTETAPVVSVNTAKHNRPESVGLPLRGVELRIGAHDELLVRGDNVMAGYWRDEQATRAVLDTEGWFRTGDQARIEDGYLFITGRLKEIIVLANGEKIAPADLEAAILEDGLFEQAMIVGEGRPFLAALVVLKREAWIALAWRLRLNPDDPGASHTAAVEAEILRRIRSRVQAFPGYARIQRVAAELRPWRFEDGLLTPTLKLRRVQILERYRDDLERLYAGHAVFDEKGKG